jgi:hypothetical protein
MSIRHRPWAALFVGAPVTAFVFLAAPQPAPGGS